MSRDSYRFSALKTFVVFALSLPLPVRILAVTPAPTTTVLTVSPANTVSAGSLVSFRASVSSGGNAVSRGLVLFCNAEATYCEDLNILGQAQLTSDGSASINLILPIGPHNIRAQFRGTTSYAASTSPSQSVNLTGGYPTTTTISAAQSAPLSLTGTVTSYGQTAPTGSVLFRDTANHNLPWSTDSLGTSSLVFSPIANSFGLLHDYFYEAVADFNGDGNLDILSFNQDNSPVVILLGQGDGTFTAGPSISIGSNPVATAVGDFNNDGIPDFAVTYGNTKMDFFLGNGDGTFSTGTSISAGFGNSFSDFYLGDFNNDGNIDLIVDSNTGVLLFLGDGTGRFSSASTLNVPLGITTRIADVNGDGNEDLIITNGAGVSVYLGNGNGTFTEGTPLTSVCVSQCDDVLVADFNGDGKPDLAVADPGPSGGLYFFLGNGNGTFRAGASYGGNTGKLALGDFNGDGKLDIEDNGIDLYVHVYPSIFLGNGNGTFANRVSLYPGLPVPQPGQFFDTFSLLGDFNNDGMTDLVPIDNVGPALISLAGWQATATASSGVVQPAFGVHPVFADYVGDESHLASSSATVPLQGQKISTTLALDVTPLPVATGQSLRLVANISPSTVGSAYPTGTVTFSNGPTVLGTRSVVGGQAAIASLSLNALDIGLRTSTLTAFYSGDTEFTSSVSLPVQLGKTGAPLPGSATVLSVSPSADVAAGTVVTLSASVADSGTSLTRGLVLFYASAPQHSGETLLGQAQLTQNGIATIKLRLGIGLHTIRAAFQGTNAFAASTSTAQDLTVTGQIATSTGITVNPPTYSASVTSYGPFAPTGDVNFSDATNNDSTFATAPLGLAQTSYSLTPTTPPFLGVGQSSVTVADFNGDGILDFATITEANQLVILLGKPDGTFYEKTSALNGFGYVLAIADFNGDGIPDIALAQSDDPSHGSLIILLGSGDGLFTKEAPIAVPVSSTFVTGDFNADGIPDLAVTSPDGSVSILLGNGKGAFAAATTLSLGAGYNGRPVVADFNGDGLMDIAIPVQNPLNPIILLLSKGDGTFITEAVSVPANEYSSSPAALTAADFNGDGFQDLFFNDFILLGNGNATFTPLGVGYEAGPGLSDAVAQDMNGDGIPDVAFADELGDVIILLGMGDGGFNYGPVGRDFVFGNGGNGFGIGDFNGDGIPDVMTALTETADEQGYPPRVRAMAEWLGTITEVSQATATNAIVPGNGTQQVFANYSGDAIHSGSQSNPVSVAGAETPVGSKLP